MTKVLVIEESRSIRNILKERLEYEDYAVECVASTAELAERFPRARFDVVLCDRMAADLPAGAYTILLSSDNSVEAAVAAVRDGAADFIPKPVDMNRLFAAVRKGCEAVAADSVEEAPAPEPAAVRRKPQHADEIVGDTPQILHVKRLIDKVAPSDARVLIMGENGTGKELVARRLHAKSRRSAAPFVEVNCAAIPSELIESELFGHEKGAFTSAIKQRRGKFEQANHGTLFMDEIGDMSLSAQAKVLRALQENKISRVGSDKDVAVDVRVVAATNKDLRREIDKGNFREDLYHRLSVIVITVPPLRERIDDLPLLVDAFVGKICDEYGTPRKEFDPEAIEELKKMPWSGNVRELRNVVERLIILSGDRVTLDDVKLYAACAV